MAIFTGGPGNDVFDGTPDPDTMNGNGGNDTLNGAGGSDILNGGDGHDILNGGAGADVMNGGTGNDSYYVDDPGDDVNEAAGEGFDRVYTTLRYYALEVGGNVENLTYIGTSNFSGYGNELDNQVIGDGGNDFLSGRNGNDALFGRAGSDILLGGFGFDVLDGGTGADRMEGGGDNDTYHVDNEGDVVVEAAGGGSDTVLTTLSYYVLGSEVENLTYSGSTRISAYGNELGNQIFGGGGDDFLNGLGGDDILFGFNGDDIIDGGPGRDVMNGGLGEDRFVFNSSSTGVGAAADRIEDFISGTDTIDLSAIDADQNTAGDQAFTFIGSSAFTGTAGELRYEASGGDTIISGDWNGDSVADFQIILTGTVTPVATDFVP